MANESSPPKSDQYYRFARPEVQALVPTTAQRILDVGCGAGALGHALKQRQQCEVWGIECIGEVAESARALLDRVIVGSVEDTSTLDEIPDSYFDAIVLADVLEHLKEPGETLKHLRRCLRPGACVVASVPNVRHWSVLKDLLEGRWEYQDAGIMDRTHLRFFTGSSLVTTFRDAGYEIGEARGVALQGCEIPAGLPAALAAFDIDASTLENESRVYQFLLVARQSHETTGGSPADARVAAPQPSGPVASLVMLTCNQLDYTRMCVESLLEHTKTPYELIVVDNGSTDGTLDYLNELVRAHTHIRLIANPVNLGFGAGNNQGMAVAEGEYIVLLNNDLILTDGWLERMIGGARRSERIGVVGPRSNRASGPQEMPAEYADLPQMHELAAHIASEQDGKGFQHPRVVGFCMLIKRAVIEKIGGFDERFGLANFEDDDFCWRVNTAGFQCWVADDVFVHHFGSRTFAGEGIDYRACMETALKWFKEKWGLAGDMQVGEDYPITQRSFQRLIHFSALPTAGDVPVRGSASASRELSSAELALKYNNYGERLYGEGKAEPARSFFDAAVALDDQCADAHNNLGVIASDRGDTNDAVASVRRAVDCDPENGKVLWNLVSLYVETGMTEHAPELLQTLLRLDPGDSQASELLQELESPLTGHKPHTPTPAALRR